MPLEFTIDPEHDLSQAVDRRRTACRLVPVLGVAKTLVILAKERTGSTLSTTLDALGKKELTLTTAAEVTNQEMSENDLLFLGPDQPPSRALFGLPDHPKQGFTLDVRRNPLNRDYVAVLVSSSGEDQTMAVARTTQPLWQILLPGIQKWSKCGQKNSANPIRSPFCPGGAAGRWCNVIHQPV